MLAGAVSSQTQTIVSPLPATATVEGTAANGYPFGSYISSRYMQVHSDVGGAPKLITRIAFRRDGPSTYPGLVRAVDVEMWLGSSVDWDRVSYVFVRNWIGTPTQVLTRQVVNIGPLVAAGSPAPFELVFPFSTPFLYIGSTSLAWDSIEYANTGTRAFNHDAEAGSATTGAAPSLTGNGCTATGQTSVMDIGVQHLDRGGAYQCGIYVQNAPANAPTILFLGASNPSLSIPGLCSALYTDMLLQVPMGNASAIGYIGEYGVSTLNAYASALSTFVLPNTLGGATLYAQAHSLDLGRTDPIAVCNSHGRSWLVPRPNVVSIVRAGRLYNFTLQGSAYPNATPHNLSHGYAAVVEFTY